MTLPSAPAEAARERHRLVSVAPDAWRSLLDRRPDVAGEPLAVAWIERGWPLIARRAGPHDGTGLPLGLPLPPAQGRRRLALLMAPEDAVATKPLPTLQEASVAAPRHWAFTLNRILATTIPLGLDVRVFGSLAWQAITGLAYVTEGSDLDLLIPAPARHDLENLLAALSAIGEKAPMRLDGEIVRPDGIAVQWRELASGAEHVLVKSATAVEMMPRSVFVEGLRS